MRSRLELTCQGRVQGIGFMEQGDPIVRGFVLVMGPLSPNTKPWSQNHGTTAQAAGRHINTKKAQGLDNAESEM